jgi:hypothetical protein
MKRDLVVSSNIHAIGYDPDTTTLEVEFTPGSIYQYFGVTAVEYEALMRAPSKGRYLNHNIKSRHSYEQVL